MSEEIIMQTNPASRILVYSSSIDTARDFVGRVKALSAAKSASSKDDDDTKPEDLELKSAANPDTISHTLSNKYYTADVHFSLKSIQTLTSEVFHHTNAPPALIYVWTTSEPYSEHVQLLSRTMQSMEYEPDVCLGVRLAVASVPTSVTPEKSTTDEEENTEIDSNLLSYGFEYVDASRERSKIRPFEVDDKISAEDSDEDDDDVPDLPRVLDALSTIMWSTMRSTQPAQTADTESSSHHLDDAEKEERDALLEELLAAGQDVRSAESQATKESAKDGRKLTYDDDDEEKLMQQMEAFIKDANSLSSFSSFKDFGSTDIDFPTENQFSPIRGLGSLDSTFDFSAFTGQPSRSESTVPLMDSQAVEGAEKRSSNNKNWLDVNSKHIPPLNTHISTPLSIQNSSQPSTTVTTSPIDEESLESFGKAVNPLPTITKHAFDDDFTDFVSAPISQPSTSTLPPTVDLSHLSLAVPSLPRSISRSSSIASDFGDHDDEHVYAMLDDASSYGGDDLDRDFEDDNSKNNTEGTLPDLNEILATTRQLFGGQIPVRNQGVPASNPSNSATTSSSDQHAPKSSSSQPPRGAVSSAEALDLDGVLGALQRFKSEIGGMTNEEDKKRMAARVALGLVYGLEGQDETELVGEAMADGKT